LRNIKTLAELQGGSMNEDFDFGFTAVDEDELEAVQAVTQKAEASSKTVNQLEDKIDKLYNAIIPLLTNLKKNPEKGYIYWPNRTSKIEQFETVLQKIIES
jgi:uncharacterized protein Yka (UPF0111/DUF47 family)